MKNIERAITFKDVAVMYEKLLAQGLKVEDIMRMEIDLKVSDYVGGAK